MPQLIKRIASRIRSVGTSLKYQLIQNDEKKIIEEMGHRLFIGKEFEQEGLRQFELVKQLGVSPSTRFLDVACGSLRLGRHLIPYLDKGGYFGIEQHQALIDGGLEHEVNANIIAEKEPTFFVNSSFELDALEGVEIAWANSLFSHLTEKDILICLTSLEKAMTKGGVFYATFFEARRNPITQWFGSHSKVGFLYPNEEMAAFGRKAGFDTEYFEDVENSRGQKMMAFRKPS